MAIDNRVATNQASPLVGHNVVTADHALVEAVERHASPAVVEDLVGLGAMAGTEEAREHGLLANRNEPELVGFDRYGNRVDEVRFHPSWHWLMERGVGRARRPAVGVGLRACPRATGGRVHGVVAHRVRARLPDLDDVRRRTCPPR
jgi:hypothetical protein